MIAAIYFYDEMVMKVSEISDIVANDMLSPELCSQLPAFDEFPKYSFSLSWIFPMLFGKLLYQRILLATRLVNIHYYLYSLWLPSFRRGRGRPYILSGTSIPNKAIPFFSVLATLRAMTRRIAFAPSLSAFRML